MQHYNVKIYGKVHGVTFRWSAKRKADNLGIVGFVRNEPDGSVFIEAEGEESALNKFLDWCKAGPLFASVQRVEFEEKPIIGYNKFEIK